MNTPSRARPSEIADELQRKLDHAQRHGRAVSWSDFESAIIALRKLDTEPRAGDEDASVAAVMHMIEEFGYVAGQCGADVALHGNSDGRKAEFNQSLHTIEQSIQRLAAQRNEGDGE